MIDPASISIVGKTLIGKHVVESIVSGNDPSLMAMSALAFSTVNPQIPKSPSSVNGDVIVAKKDMGTLASTDPNISQHVVLEQYVDSKYMNHGNLEDAWSQLKNGEMTFDTFVLAMVDIVDALTLGVFKPLLLEVKINPHLKAREVVYRAEVSYDTPEQSINETIVDGTKKQETTNTQRRITQVSKITFEISPEAFQKADLTFAECVNRIKSADIADRTVVYARLDTLTENDLKIFCKGGLKEINTHSERLQSVVTPQNLLASAERKVSELTANGGIVVDDRENRFSTINLTDNTSAPKLTEKQMTNADIKVYGVSQSSADQRINIQAQQQETIDHLKETRNIKSTVTEQIDSMQIAEEYSGKMKWTRDGTRIREAAGQYDIFTLKDVSVDEFVRSGGELLSDRAWVQDTIVAVDISQSGEKLNFVNSEKKRAWLIQEADIRRDRSTSTETQTWRVAKQITEYDYLANSKEIRSATIHDKVVTTTSVKDIVKSKTHWNLFGWNSAGFLGENIKTETSPTVTTQTSIYDIELAPDQDIFSNFNASKKTLVANGGKISNHSSDTNAEKLEITTQRSFDEGAISSVPFVGGIGHLASKAALKGGVTLQDAFWAAADVAEIAIAAAAIPSIATSIGAKVTSSVSKNAAKVATKTAIKMAEKNAVKTAAKTGIKSAVKTSGKAVVKGSVHIAGKSSAKLTAKPVAKKLAIHSVKQTGKITLKNGGLAGPKVNAAKSGSIIRYKHIPRNGTWLGKPGDSKWVPTADSIPSKLNPNEKSWGKILSENNMQKEIPFKKGYPDFHTAAYETVKINNFTGNRTKNFAQADSKLAEAIRSGKKINPDILNMLNSMGVDPNTVTKGDIKLLRKHGYCWHERQDTKTLDLIKRELHANVPHSGGISALKEQNNLPQ